jgi:rhodanese-related sulfurtransferase
MRAAVFVAIFVLLAISVLMKRRRITNAPMLSPEKALDAIKAGNGVQLIDVRTAQEFAEGHLQGAQNVPLQELKSRLSEILPDRQIVVYCMTDGRSRQALKILKAYGYRHPQAMTGGITAWIQASYPIVT